MKYCRKCCQTKETIEFAKNRSKPDGLQDWCRVCTGVKSRKHDTAAELKVKQAELTQTFIDIHDKDHSKFSIRLQSLLDVFVETGTLSDEQMKSLNQIKQSLT